MADWFGTKDMRLTAGCPPIHSTENDQLHNGKSNDIQRLLSPGKGETITGTELPYRHGTAHKTLVRDSKDVASGETGSRCPHTITDSRAAEHRCLNAVSGQLTQGNSMQCLVSLHTITNKKPYNNDLRTTQSFTRLQLPRGSNRHAAPDGPQDTPEMVLDPGKTRRHQMFHHERLEKEMVSGGIHH